MSRFTTFEISEWCIAQVARTLDIAPERINPNSKFSRLGLDSAMSVSLILALEEWLGREVSPELVFDYPTIAELSEHLARFCCARETSRQPIG
jgi:acyl carrier protein